MIAGMVFGMIAAYFLLAVFIPRLRTTWWLRWTKSGDVARKGIHWTPPKIERGPFMGWVTCLGLAVLMLSFGAAFAFGIAPGNFVGIGFGLFFVGFFMDCWSSK